jgi:hypothetical protein
VDEPAQNATTDTSLVVLLKQFEQRYEKENSEVRSLSCDMQELLQTSNALLDELDQRPWWQRVWQFVVGHTAQVKRKTARTQVQLLHTNTLLMTAIGRQNRMVMEGLRLTLEKLHRIEQDAAILREVVLRVEQRREARRQRWRPVTRRFRQAFVWTRDRVARLVAPSRHSS